MRLPIAGPINLAVSFFAINNVVQDVTYTTTDGEDTQNAPTSRTVRAAVNPTNSKKLEMIFGATVESGDIGIYTKEILYTLEAYEAGETMIQSFLTYAGLVYRIMAKGDWSEQANMNVYLGRRHLRQDLV